MAGKDKSKDLAERGAQGKPVRSSRDEIAAFVGKARELAAMLPGSGERGRLIFALDATMSRQPTWDSACQLQAEMFHRSAEVGGLDVQLVYFRGFGECRASKWVGNPDRLGELMSAIDCRGGHTQIAKVLAHARKEAARKRVHAVVYVGDCMEEDVDRLCAHAGELGLLHVPLFMFQEGHDSIAERCFKEMARLSGGAWSRFDSGAADQLRDLLSAVAIYASGGRAALEKLSGSGKGRLLLQQLR